MPLYSTNATDVLIRSDLQNQLGTQAEVKASNADVTNKGIIGLIKGVWQTLLDRLPALSNGAIPVTVAGQGSATTITKTSASITTSSTSLLAANSNRIGFVISNPSSNTANVYIEFAATASATDGLIIPPGYERTQDYPYLGVISVIGSAACSIVVREFVK